MLWKKPRKIHAESSALIQASKDGPATFEARPAYSGGVLRVAGYRFGVVIDLAGLTVNKKVLANLDHDAKKRVGHITDHTNDGKTLFLAGVMSADSDSTREVLASHDRGFQWDCSIEAIPSVKPEMVEAGKTVFVNGQTFSGPLEIARKSTLFGLGFVSIGADSENAVAIAAEEIPLEETTEAYDEAFAKFAEEHGFDAMTMSEEERAALEVLFMQSQSSSDEPVTASFDPKLIRAEATKTYDLIEAKVLEYEDTIKDQKVVESIQATAFDKMQSLKRIAAAQRYTCDRFQKESTKILAELSLELIRAERPKGPGIISSSRDTVMNPNFIQASLHIQSGREDLALKHFGEQTTEAARKTGPRSLLETCETVIKASGAEVPRDRNEMIKMALRPIHAGGFSNVSLPTVFQNTMGRVLEQPYLEGTDNWRPFATIKSAENFKPQTSMRPSAAGNLERVAPNGELKHQILKEEATYPWQVSSWGCIETIGREAIVNDDMSYFNERPMMHGVAAARTVNDLFWRTVMGTVFTNSLTLALDIPNLASAISTMKIQRDSQGNSIDVRPVALCVAPQLESAARQALRSTELVHGTAGQGSANPMFNAVEHLISEPRLSNASFPNAAADTWYLFAGPLSNAVVVGYLQNRMTPTIESEPAPFNVLGVSLRCYFDFGIAVGDQKGCLVSNP